MFLRRQPVNDPRGLFVELIVAQRISRTVNDRIGRTGNPQHQIVVAGLIDRNSTRNREDQAEDDRDCKQEGLYPRTFLFWGHVCFSFPFASCHRSSSGDAKQKRAASTHCAERGSPKPKQPNRSGRKIRSELLYSCFFEIGDFSPLHINICIR